MLRQDQEVASYLYYIDEESEVHTITSQWLNVCHIGLKTFRKRLSLDDVMIEDKATRSKTCVGFNRVVDELKSSSRQHRYKWMGYVYIF